MMKINDFTLASKSKYLGGGGHAPRALQYSSSWCRQGAYQDCTDPVQYSSVQYDVRALLVRLARLLVEPVRKLVRPPFPLIQLARLLIRFVRPSMYIGQNMRRLQIDNSSIVAILSVVTRNRTKKQCKFTADFTVFILKKFYF